MQFFWLSLNIMLRLLGLVRLSNLCKSNPNVFSLIYSIACLTLSFLWSQWQEQICISLDVSTQARLVWFWKAQLCPSAVCCGKVTLLVGVAKSKRHAGVQRKEWKEWLQADHSRKLCYSNIFPDFVNAASAGLQRWTRVLGECQCGWSWEFPQQWELKFWMAPLGVYITEIINRGIWRARLEAHLNPRNWGGVVWVSRDEWHHDNPL